MAAETSDCRRLRRHLWCADKSFITLITKALQRNGSQSCLINGPLQKRQCFASDTVLQKVYLQGAQLTVCPGSQIARVLWNQKVHHRLHKTQPLVPILSQISPIHTLQTHFPKIRFNIIVSSTSRS